jgi:methyltransferase (TIGR00027 family)
MREGVPSRTALRVAMRRAAHQILDHPKVLDDPLAVSIVGEAIAEVRANETRHQSRIARSFRAFMVARSRYAEDQLADSVSRGVRQYVILGAGLDTSAYRGIAASESLRVFEVDHPQTQAWKKERLQAVPIAIPPNVSFVPVDFEKQNLPAELAAAGFMANRPAFVSWLGVVPYLTREAASDTFAFLGRFPRDSGVAFDYAVTPSSLPLLERLAVRALANRVSRVGEPFQLFFTPPELEDFLKARGFQRVEQLAANDINERYFSGRPDGLRAGGSAGRIVSSWT